MISQHRLNSKFPIPHFPKNGSKPKGWKKKEEAKVALFAFPGEFADLRQIIDKEL